MTASPSKSPFSVLARPWALLLALLVVALLVFHALWRPGAVLQCSDNNVGNVAAERNALLVAPPHEWFNQLWGLPFPSRVTLTHTFQMLLPPVLFTNTIYALCLLFGAFFVALYLRDKALGPLACLYGGLVAFWTGTNLTLIYAGHLGKYGVLLFLGVALWLLGRWGRTRRAGWAALAAAAVGGMFLEQVDVAAFCAVLLVPAAFFELAQFPATTLKTPRFWLVQVAPAAVVAVLLVVGAAAATWATGAADNVDAMTPVQHWSYLTQWSQPPAESLDFVAPGWTGWRSGDPEGPYWGVMGRSDDWPANPSGFMNFKLENVYVGAIPALLSLLAVVAAFARRKADADAARRWHFVLLWTLLGLAALILSFGKYTPLYRLVAALPGFSAVRNPNKFIHFFQVAWGILAALGLDACSALAPKSRRRWAFIAYALAAVFAISWAAIWSDASLAATQLANAGWSPAAASAITAAKAFALLWAAISLLLAALALHLWPAPPEAASLPTNATSQPTSPAKSTKKNTLPFNGKSAETRFHSMEKVPKHVSIQWKHVLRSALPAVPVLMLLLDAAVILAPHYLQAMPRGYIAKNDAIDYLQTHLDGTRMAFPQQDGFYNFWLTYLFLYYDIPTISATQVPHPPADYTAFWGAVRDPVRLWRLTAVSTLFMHGPAAASLLADATLGPQFRLDWAYQPADDGDGGIATRPLPLPDPATPAAVARLPEVALKFKSVPPRVAIANHFETLDDDTALRRLAAPDFTPLETVLLPPGTAAAIGPDALAAAPSGPLATNAATLLETRTGHLRFTVHADAPCLARIADKYDPGWRATLNDAPASVHRCDYMFQCVWIPSAGTWTVDLTYRPTSLPVTFQLAGLLLALLLSLPLLRPSPTCPTPA